MTRTKIMIGCSLFCLVTGGALLLGILRDVRQNKELYSPLLAVLVLFVASWNILYGIYLYKRNG